MPNIYHITHLSNLPGILQERGLWCDDEIAKRNIDHQGIAYLHIKERRKRRGIEVGQGGIVADYVPFYFCPRSPMLYSIHKGFVPSYQGNQEKILHLVSRTEIIDNENMSFVFSDGHAEMEISQFYDSLSQLNLLDWSVINSWSWKDTLADNDRKRRKQAEFLVHKFFPWNLICEIGVHNVSIKHQVEALLENSFYKPVVNVRRKWYYDS